MKSKLFPLILISLCFAVSVSAQSDNNVKVTLPDPPGEIINIFTDRSSYLVSDEIHFSIYYTPPEVRYSRNWSMVIYVELINWDGTKIANSIVPLKEGIARGRISVPGEVYSGVYYMRAYSKWMRNYTPYVYTYLPIKIVNPNSPNIVSGPEQATQSLNSDIIFTGKLKKDIKIDGLKNNYSSRERVDLQFLIDESFISGDINISVTKEAASPSGFNNSLLRDPGETTTAVDLESIEFLPEINGLTLTGNILDQNLNPVVGERINLSSYTNSVYFSTSVSDEKGEFDFVLPDFTGEYEFNLGEQSIEKTDHQILVSGQFCSKSVKLPYIPFSLDSTEMDYVKEAYINQQLESRFPVQNEKIDDQQNLLNIPFFGYPTSITFVKEFIELQDLREFCYELVAEISIRAEGQNARLEVNSQGSLQLFPPLVLLDNIRVSNDNDLLKIPSRRVQRIEVLKHGFVVGDEKFSGIIAIHSNNKDMAGLELKSKNNFFNYQLYGNSPVPGEEISGTIEKSNIPDLRSLLFWNSVTPEANLGPIPISFFTSDVKGTYVITLQGQNKKGDRIVVEAGKFIVD